MSWLENQVAEYGEQIAEDIQRYLRTSGVTQEVNFISGAYGVRRFLLHFSVKGATVAISEIESIPLQTGGGAPTMTSKENMAELERALTRLYNNMQGGLQWSKGVLGCIRDCDNQLQLFPFFNEDSEKIAVEKLPIPPTPHPLEGATYLRLKASMQAQIEPVVHRSQSLSHEWSVWEIEQNELFLVYGDPDRPERVDRHKCKVLGTFGADSYWDWQVEEPLFDEKIFCWENFVGDWDSVVELALMTTARLKADWLFISVVGDGESSLFVAVWDV